MTFVGTLIIGGTCFYKYKDMFVKTSFLRFYPKDLVFNTGRNYNYLRLFNWNDVQNGQI